MKLAQIIIMLFMVITMGFSFELELLETFYTYGAPKAVEVSDDGKYAAVMNLEGRNFWLINTETLEVSVKGQFTKTAATGYNYTTHTTFTSYAEKPVECDFSDNGRYLWMSYHNGECVVVYDIWNIHPWIDDDTKLYDDEQKVTIEDLEYDYDDVVYIPSIDVGSTPKVITITPDGKYACVANWHSYSVSIIDIETLTEIEEIEIGVIVRGMAVSSDSKTLYVARMGGGGISVIDLETFVVEETLWPKNSWNPRHIILSQDDRYLYISDNASGTVLKYDLEDEEVDESVYVGTKARTIAITPDESLIFAVSHGDGVLATIDAETFEIIDEIEYYKPMGLSVSPDGEQLWVTSYQGGYVSVYGIEY